MTKTRLPALPPPSDPNFSTRLSEILQVFMGNRGDQLDRVVTFRDLDNQTVAERLVNNGLRRAASGATAGAVGGTTLPTLTIPPAVTGAAIGGSFTRMILSWTAPGYANHAYTEVLRSTSNDISTGVLVGTTPTAVYVDVVGGGFTGYYWLRHVNTDGATGPWTAALTATTPASHVEVMETLTSTQWQAATGYTIFTPIAPTTEIVVDGASIRLVAVSTGVSGGTEPDWATAITTLGDTVVDGSVTWQAVEVGQIPFFIDPVSGLVVIDGASIREASIESLMVKDGFFDTMTAAKGTLSEANISIANIFNALIQNYIRSDSYSPGVSGWTINKDGTAEFQDIIARGDVEASTLKASTVMVYSGNIANLQVDTIHIAGQAVTFASSVDLGTPITLSSGVFGGEWTDVVDLTFTPSDTTVPINLWLTILYEPQVQQDSSDNDTNGNEWYTEMKHLFRLYRGATLIKEFTGEIGRRVWDQSAPTDWGEERSLAFHFYDQPNSASAVTYTLQVKEYSGTGVSGISYAAGSLNEATMTVLEVKK